MKCRSLVATVRPRHVYTQIKHSDMPKPKASSNTSVVLRRTIKQLPAGITGALSSKREDWILSIGHLFQRARAREFLSGLQTEWDAYVEKGKIKPGYESTDQHKTCLQEMLDALDHDCPDEIRFMTMKKILLVAACESNSDRKSILPNNTCN